MTQQTLKNDPDNWDYSFYSDAHKEAYGFRPRSFEWATKADFEADLDRVLRAAQDSIDLREREQQEAIAEFEAYVSRVQEQFGVDRETAIRWDMEAYDSEDKETHCYNRNLPFSYEDKF